MSNIHAFRSAHKVFRKFLDPPGEPVGTQLLIMCGRPISSQVRLLEPHHSVRLHLRKARGRPPGSEGLTPAGRR